MAPKVGISACILDGVPSRRVGVYWEGFWWKNFVQQVFGYGCLLSRGSVGLCFFFASAYLMRALKVYTSVCILHDRYWHVFGDRLC